ncbi:MAG: hypothetical protein EBQ82_03780 [Betaproteobacteria bacterium]|nr:hypothetical protein [Betaproteobacteria bacterium]NBY04524.1 hypothetical protein [Betaproteobacteria bacterium]
MNRRNHNRLSPKVWPGPMPMRLARQVGALCLCWCAAAAAWAEAFDFVAIGDLPYGNPSVAYGPYRALIDQINREAPDFSVHVGDFKSGSSPCSDAEFQAQLAHFARFKNGLIYTPGDNEWTDCHRPSNGSHDPVERLNKLRQIFFPSSQSLGQSSIQLLRQPSVHPQHADHVENAFWMHKQVAFATVHIVGSNNNFETRSPPAVQEFFKRDAANVDWIKHAFTLAQERQAKALVFAFQADVFESKNQWEDFPAHSGFARSVGETLLPLAAQSRLPILIVHGDSHVFKFDQAFQWQKKPLPSVYRLVVPGAQDVRAVMVSVDTLRTAPFQIRLISPP